MKAIARFVLLLLLVCGTTLAWKSPDRRFRPFSVLVEGSRQKEAGESLQNALPAFRGPGLGFQAEAGWVRADFQTKLEEAFQKNDPCAVMELIRSGKNVSPREFWSAGMAVLLSQGREQKGVLEELLANPDSPFYGHPRESSTRRETRFFNALLYSGQMRGMEESEGSSRRSGLRNYEKAIEILKKLLQEDGDNGAYAYFLAAALRQNGATKDEVQRALNQASKAGRFDPFYQGLFDSLQVVAYLNSATFTWVHSFLESMPLPDYEISIRYLKYWARNDEIGKWVALRAAKHLIELGSSYKTSSPGYQFSRTEYLLGQNLKYSVEGLMEKSWDEYMTKMRQAQDFISETPRLVVDAEVNLYRSRIQAKRSCGPDSWKSLYAAYKSKRQE